MSRNLNFHAASVDQLRQRAKSRIPGFAYEYLSGGCITDCSLKRNRVDLDAIFLQPQYLRPKAKLTTEVELFGQKYSVPFGIAPIGLGGLIWPRGAEYLASAAKQSNLPFVLSTVASTSIETAAKYAEENFWFQLYPPPDEKVRDNLIQRADDVGCKNLVVTIDVPVLGRRPRDIRNGLSMPPSLTTKNIFQTVVRPRWALASLITGIPQFEVLKPYMEENVKLKSAANYVRSTYKEPVDENLLGKVRDRWPHNLIVKGILNLDDAHRAISAGADGLIISNHGGRQLDAARSTISVTREISEGVGDKAIVMADSGVESGVDIARFLAQGARMVFAGRAFMYGVAGLGAPGAAHTIKILAEELTQTMGQLGCENPARLREHLP